jgi:phosphopantetheinyl transferase
MVIPASNCIHCFFEPDMNRLISQTKGEVEVYYGITADLTSGIQNLINNITFEEKQRAERFHIPEERYTYIACHGLLRAILSRKLRERPSDIVFTHNRNNKPELPGNPYYFNISHDMGAFALVFSKFFYAGIDIERVNKNVDFLSVINTYFSANERNFIKGSDVNAIENFILLWTRKESLLKAVGTGIIDDLTSIEVSGKKNRICRESLNNEIDGSVFSKHYIYTHKFLDHWLSITIPQKENIKLIQINEDNIHSLLT